MSGWLVLLIGLMSGILGLGLGICIGYFVPTAHERRMAKAIAEAQRG